MSKFNFFNKALEWAHVVMIKLDLGPIAGSFNLAGTYSWKENGIEKAAAFNVTMRWNTELPTPVVDVINWVDPIHEEQKQKAEAAIRGDLDETGHTFSVIYH